MVMFFVPITPEKTMDISHYKALITVKGYNCGKALVSSNKQLAYGSSGCSSPFSDVTIIRWNLPKWPWSYHEPQQKSSNISWSYRISKKNGSHFVWRSERKKNESFSTPWRHVLQQLRQHSSMILSYTCPYSMATRGSNRTFKGAPQGQAVFRAEARCGACGDLGLISSGFVCS